MKRESKLKTVDIAYISAFTVFIALCSWLSIPLSVAVTMQSFGVFLCLGVLGGKKGTLGVLGYLLLGLCGLPVFSGFNAGVGAFMSAGGGYLIGFLAAALVMWLIERFFGNSNKVYFISMLIGLCICYILGTIWFVFIFMGDSAKISLYSAVAGCVLPFVIPDLLKIALALYLRKRIYRLLYRI